VLSPLEQTCHTDSVVSIHPRVHATALISPSAFLDVNVQIGPFSVVGDHVHIGEGSIIGAHVIIERDTLIGKRNHIYHGAIVGSNPQDLKYQGEDSTLVIGNDNTIREYVTINRGTLGGGGETRIGNHNLLMSHVHIAHDVKIGDYNVLSQNACVGGHVIIEDQVTLGGISGIRQFVKIGRLAMIGANSMVAKDVPPYALIDGNPVKCYGINIIGLRRHHFTADERLLLQRAYKILFRSGLTLTEAIQTITETLPMNHQIEQLIRFLHESTRGIYR